MVGDLVLVMIRLFAFILYLEYVLCFEMPPSWVDPGDLHHSRSVANLSPTEDTSDLHACRTSLLVCQKSLLSSPKYEGNCEIKSDVSPCASYYARLLNLFLVQTNMQNYRLPKGQYRAVSLTLYFTPENLDIIQAYASDNHGKYSWHEVDQALVSLFIYPKKEQEDEIPLDAAEGGERNYVLFYIIAVPSVILLLGLYFYLTSRSVSFTILGICFIIFSIALTSNLYREYHLTDATIKAENMQMGDIPLDCKPQSSMTWKEYAKSFWGSKVDCKQYLLNQEGNPLHRIDFGKVVVETFCLLFEVLPNLGAKAGMMLKNYSDTLPFGVSLVFRIVIQLLFPILIPITLIITLLVVKGFVFRVPFASFEVNRDVKCDKNKINKHMTRTENKSPALETTTPRKRMNKQATDRVGTKYVAVENMYEPSSSTHSSTNASPTNKVLDNRNKHQVNRVVWMESVVRYGFFTKRTLKPKQMPEINEIIGSP